MLSLIRSGAIYLCTQPTDMRKSFDGLLRAVEEFAARSVFEGGLFLFVGRRRDRVKLLYWDEDGLAIWYKRLEEGTFELPRIEAGAKCVTLSARELGMLLGGIELSSVRRRRRFERPASHASG